MPKNRIGFSSDFVLKNELVGIGTADPKSTLHVLGNTRTQNTIVSGVTTLTKYSGFLHDRQDVLNDVGLTSSRGNLSSLAAELSHDVDLSVTGLDSLSVQLGSLDELSVGTEFKVPTGSIQERNDPPVAGFLRFNQDTGNLEFFNGNVWKSMLSYQSPGGGRGVFAGGRLQPVTYMVHIDYINISTTGNALSFGSLTTTTGHSAGCASETRGIVAGGGPVGSNVIEYLTTASSGNSQDFGDLTVNGTYMSGGLSSSTRGVFCGREGPTPLSVIQNVIDYITIATTGNALDFGDLRTAKSANYSVASPVRGITAGGQSPTFLNSMEFLTISSTGNTVDFGSLSSQNGSPNGCSNSTRGIFGGGLNPVSSIKTIDYITIATSGNALDFGDLTYAHLYAGACASSTRGVFAGGTGAPTAPTIPDTNVMDYITLMSLGNSSEFGDLTYRRRGMSTFSDCHGGLGGF